MLRRAPRGPALALPSSPSLFPSFAPVNLDGQWDSGMKELHGASLCGVVSRLLRTLLAGPANSCKYQQFRPGSLSLAADCSTFPAEYGEESTFYNPEWHGKSNLMSRRRRTRTEAATVLKAAQIPPRLIQSLSAAAVEQEHKALSPWEE